MPRHSSGRACENSVMSPLHLVPPSEPSAGEAALLRVKRRANPDGALQCNRCGSRTSLTLTNGSTVRNGRITGGTVLLRHVCAECWKRGVTQFMLPEVPREAPKPRRPRPKLVKP
jgi:hypothetical protein